MSDKDNGGAAFPWNSERDDVPGMTLRDYFAAKAMQGFMSRADWTDRDFDGEARAAYRAADAMIKARQP